MTCSEPANLKDIHISLPSINLIKNTAYTTPSQYARALIPNTISSCIYTRTNPSSPIPVTPTPPTPTPIPLHIRPLALSPNQPHSISIPRHITWTSLIWFLIVNQISLRTSRSTIAHCNHVTKLTVRPYHHYTFTPYTSITRSLRQATPLASLHLQASQFS